MGGRRSQEGVGRRGAKMLCGRKIFFSAGAVKSWRPASQTGPRPSQHKRPAQQFRNHPMQMGVGAGERGAAGCKGHRRRHAGPPKQTPPSSLLPPSQLPAAAAPALCKERRHRKPAHQLAAASAAAHPGGCCWPGIRAARRSPPRPRPGRRLLPSAPFVCCGRSTRSLLPAPVAPCARARGACKARLPARQPSPP